MRHLKYIGVGALVALWFIVAIFIGYGIVYATNYEAGKLVLKIIGVILFLYIIGKYFCHKTDL